MPAPTYREKSAVGTSIVSQKTGASHVARRLTAQLFSTQGISSAVPMVEYSAPSDVLNGRGMWAETSCRA